MSFESAKQAICIGKAGLAVGTTTTFTITTAVTASVGGKAIALAAASNGATPTTDHVTGAAFTALARGQGCVFVFGCTATNTTKVIQGEIVDLLGTTVATTTWPKAPSFPGIPADFCPIGYLLIKIGSDLVASTWTLGTSNLASTTGMSSTFVDVVTLPNRPQTS